MRKNWLNHILKQNGLSLVEMSIATFVLAIIATGMTKFASVTRNSTKAIEAKFTELELIARVEKVLSETTSCSNSFATTAIGGTISRIEKDGGYTILEVRGTYGTGASRVVVDSINVGGSVSGEGTYALPVTIAMTKPGVKPPASIQREITLMANVDASGTITKCYGQSDSAIRNGCELGRGSFDGTTCHYLTYIHDFDASIVGDDAIASTEFVRDAFINQSIKYDNKFVKVAGDTMTGSLVASGGLSTTSLDSPDLTATNANIASVSSHKGFINSATVTTQTSGGVYYGAASGDQGTFSSYLKASRAHSSGTVDGDSVIIRTTVEASTVTANSKLTVAGVDVATKEWVNSVLLQNLTENQKEQIFAALVANTASQTGVNAIASKALSKLHFGKSILGTLYKNTSCIAGTHVKGLTVDSTGLIKVSCGAPPAPLIVRNSTCEPVTITYGWFTKVYQPEVVEIKAIGRELHYYCDPIKKTTDGDAIKSCNSNDSYYPLQRIEFYGETSNLSKECPKYLYKKLHSHTECLADGGTIYRNAFTKREYCDFSSGIPAGWTSVNATLAY